MAVNPYINKVVYGDQTLLDLTADTVTANKILTGYTAHSASGASITGNCDFDANTQDATAAVAEVLATKTFYGQGVKKTGTMPNNGAVTGVISTKAQEYTIAQGYHDGSGKVSINGTEQAKIIGDNIKEGVTILGVLGTYSGGEVTAQSKTVTSSAVQQVVLPDAGYDYLSQVTVNAMPYVETDNAAGGKTATIG